MRLALCIVIWLAAVTPARAERLTIGGGTLQISIQSGADLSDREILDWVRGSATAVAAYFGKFPIPELAIAVSVDDRSGVHGGVTNGWPEPHIRIKLGRRTARTQLELDWVLVHEMCHTAFPNVDRDHHAWAEEGLSTYVEPIARLRSGGHTREQVWLELARGLPQGLPDSGDRGLDHTPTWGRTYWGGALFWLIADIEIREKTGLKKGLPDALRGILAAGGDVRADWPLSRALAEGDRAIGASVLVPLHARLAEDSTPVDLAGLWAKLGVKVEGRQVTFDDTAPLARVRRAIEAR